MFQVSDKDKKYLPLLYDCLERNIQESFNNKGGVKVISGYGSQTDKSASFLKIKLHTRLNQ
jgi:hypothetical protein